MLGLVEGIAEATSQISRVFSGWLSDLLGRRKALTVAGYGLAAATKPLFPLATSVATVLIARFADRVGKGIRAAPRDALVADVTPAEQRGEAFGLRQSLDTVGAILGPVTAKCLSGRALAGQDRCTATPDLRALCSDRGRSPARLRPVSRRALPWHRPVGVAYGAHPRCARGPRRGNGARAFARERLRPIWSHHRACRFGGKRVGRNSVGHYRADSDVRSRRLPRRRRPGWLPASRQAAESRG